jgi:3-deoxy-D-manno-octulosonate 8-phosphate phosphatase (KDO 8-P phosphatase)
MKAFSIKDGYVINFILKPANIVPIVITARNSSIVKKRCEELGIKEVYQGKLDKLTTLKEIIGEDSLGACAYFGDDILDLSCMTTIKQAGGIVACPADSALEVKSVVHYLCSSKAGDGALREFVEWLVSNKEDAEDVKKRIDEAVDLLNELKVSESDVGKKIIVNENFFYHVQSYDTKPVEQCEFESHREYIDIQILVKGREAMDLADISRLEIKESYDSEKDVVFWKAPERMSRVTLREGDSIILYPENAHRGAVSIKGNEHVLKLVGKVHL